MAKCCVDRASDVLRHHDPDVGAMSGGQEASSRRVLGLTLRASPQHYFADSSLPSYDAEAAALLTRRVLEFLDRV
jgi:hypothetical protein